MWTPTTLLRINHQRDREQASNGYSRYGVYVLDRLNEFRDWDDTSPLSAERFAATAWNVATPPILTGYVEHRPGIRPVHATIDDDGVLVFNVEVPLRRDALQKGRQPHWRWQDWANDDWPREGDYQGLQEPSGKHGPALLTTARLLIPATDWDLPAQECTSGRQLVAEAQRVVEVIAERLNQEAGPVVARVLGETIGG